MIARYPLFDAGLVIALNTLMVTMLMVFDLAGGSRLVSVVAILRAMRKRQQAELDFPRYKGDARWTDGVRPARRSIQRRCRNSMSRFSSAVVQPSSRIRISRFRKPISCWRALNAIPRVWRIWAM